MADNLTRIILSAIDNASGVLASVKGNLDKMESSANLAEKALAGIGVTFSGAAMVAMVKGTIDAADGFNDLAQRVGIGIKELAGWTLAANQSGTSMEAVAKGVKGLSGYMVEHADKLRAAGITATDANGAMVQLADLFASMPDGVEKTTLAVQLFGKSGMEMIPMLNQGSAGLAEAQEKAAAYGRKLAEIAPNADKFNDEMAELAMQSKAAGMNITGFLLPGLIGMAKLVNDLKAGGDRRDTALEFLAEMHVPVVGDMYDAMRHNRGPVRSRGYTGPKNAQGLPASAADRAAQEMADFDRATAAYEAEFAGRQRARGLLDKGTGTGSAAAKYKRSFDPEADFFYAVDEAQRKAARAQMDANDKEMEALEKKRIAMEDMAEKRMETNRIESEGEEAIRESLEKTSREMARQKTMAQDLGFTFASAFENAIVGGRGLQSILQGLAQDVARLFLRKQVTEPMAAGLSSFFSGSQLLGRLFGGGGGGGGFDWMPSSAPSFAGGGYTGGRARSGGMDGQGGFLAMLHPQETVIDHAAGQSGGIVVNLIEDSSRAGKVQKGSNGGVPVLDIFVEQIRGVIAADISRGNGPVPAALAGTYGLNRAAGAY